MELDLSLKIFHILFISLSTVLSFGFGIWALRYHHSHQGMFYMVVGFLSLVLGVLLILYEIGRAHV